MLEVFLWEGDAYGLLARAVHAVWGWTELPEIARLPGGKPVFANYPDHHFSLSHSGTLALVALSDAPVGCDMELVRPRREGLPAYVFRGEGYERYRSLGGDWEAFYTLWTQLESIIKYTGEGLKARRRAVLPEGCTVTPFQGELWRAAVCGHEKGNLNILKKELP